MHFVIFAVDKPGHEQLRLDTRPAHVDYLKANADIIVTAGPMQTDDGEHMIGSTLVIDVEGRADAMAFAEGDPYAKAGLFESTRVMRWKQVIPAD